MDQEAVDYLETILQIKKAELEVWEPFYEQKLKEWLDFCTEHIYGGEPF